MNELLLTLAQNSSSMGGEGLAMGGAAIGAGLVCIGAGIGIGRAAGAACEATARQPESGANIFRNMIIGAALIEGVSLFALVISFMVWQSVKP